MWEMVRALILKHRCWLGKTRGAEVPIAVIYPKHSGGGWTASVRLVKAFVFYVSAWDWHNWKSSCGSWTRSTCKAWGILSHTGCQLSPQWIQASFPAGCWLSSIILISNVSIQEWLLWMGSRQVHKEMETDSLALLSCQPQLRVNLHPQRGKALHLTL